jgi:LysM repeat protein
MQFKLSTLLLFTALIFGDNGFAGKPKTHVIQKGDTPAQVAKRNGITIDELFRYNNLKPNDSFRVGATLKIPKAGEVTGSTYTVAPGDSIAKIADFHGCSQNDLREANGLKEGSLLRVGQELTIPYALRGGVGHSHVVRKGDTLGGIAAKYKVPVRTLANANKLSEKTPLEIGRTLIIPEEETPAKEAYKPPKVSKLIKSGEKVPGGVRHEIQPGQSLWTIARAYNTTGDRIAEANDFDAGVPLMEGQKILIPGAPKVVPVRIKGFAVQPVRFVSVWNNKSENLRLLTNSGKLNRKSRKQLSKLAGPKGNQKSKRIKLFVPRLIHMLQRVAERFPGHTIEIISGYRPPKKGHGRSMHNVGRAIDFRVRGIDRKELYDYIKQLPNVGAGYYPNSVFVHMDVRDKKALWTDLSGIGEAPLYEKDLFRKSSEINEETAANALKSLIEESPLGETSD